MRESAGERLAGRAVEAAPGVLEVGILSRASDDAGVSTIAAGPRAERFDFGVRIEIQAWAFFRQPLFSQPQCSSRHFLLVLPIT